VDEQDPPPKPPNGTQATGERRKKGKKGEGALNLAMAVLKSIFRPFFLEIDHLDHTQKITTFELQSCNRQRDAPHKD